MPRAIILVTPLRRQRSILQPLSSASFQFCYPSQAIRSSSFHFCNTSQAIHSSRAFLYTPTIRNLHSVTKSYVFVMKIYENGARSSKIREYQQVRLRSALASPGPKKINNVKGFSYLKIGFWSNDIFLDFRTGWIESCFCDPSQGIRSPSFNSGDPSQAQAFNYATPLKRQLTLLLPLTSDTLVQQ